VEDLVVSPALDNHIAHGGERHRRLSDDFDSVSLGLLLVTLTPPRVRI
jgi:hypothetical protein